MARIPTLALLIAACLVPTAPISAADAPPAWNWKTASPESQDLDSAQLDAAWQGLRDRQTTAFVVIRRDRIVYERYADAWSRTKPHGTASLAKALVGGMSLMLATSDGRIAADDPASRYIAAWRNDPKRRGITIRELATHTSGIEDAEDGNVPHQSLTGWKGDFWKQLAPPHDPFTIARDVAPVLDEPGTSYRYSNPGMALLGYCLAASLRGAPQPNLRSLLGERIMGPLGVPADQWSVGYGKTVEVDHLPLVATWGGATVSPDAAARVGRLLLDGGEWDGKQLIPWRVVITATTPSGMPGHSGLGWWVNRTHEGGRFWNSAPDDAFWGSGAGHQFLLVIPSLDLIVVRFGQSLDAKMDHHAALDKYIVAPVMQAVARPELAPYPQSSIVWGLRWAPRGAILRQAQDSDNWPITWADDDNLYAAYGDGHGFEPKVREKLGLGFAKVVGSPPEFSGLNIRSASGEQSGSGAKGKKASGMLMVGGVLYMWTRNAANSQLAWSPDHGATWTWADWKFSTSFGCPTFLNFGKNYAGARDEFTYVYSPDSDSAYSAADRMVLARVPATRVKERDAYEFYAGLNSAGEPQWAADIGRRAAVFQFPGNCGRTSVSYDAGLHRYLWCQTLPGGDARFRGGFGIYDAPEPWGPWTTVYFNRLWDVGPGETCSLPTKWMSADGRKLHLLFSGDDYFAVREATLLTSKQ